MTRKLNTKAWWTALCVGVDRATCSLTSEKLKSCRWTSGRGEPPNPINIKGTEVDIVDCYKYLGVRKDKLDCTANTNALFKKGQSHLFLLRILRSFNVCRTILQMFYHSVVSSVIFYAVVCWGSRVKTADANRLDKFIRRAGSVLGVELQFLAEVSEQRMLRKLLNIFNKPHPLHATLDIYCRTFGCRLRPQRCSIECHRNSFLPVAIKLFNSSPFFT